MSTDVGLYFVVHHGYDSILNTVIVYC